MKKSYTFMLSFGYAESQSLAFVPFTSTQKFASAKEALLDLSQFMLEHYVAKHTQKLKKCCEESKARDTNAKFCSQCSRSLEAAEFDVDDFMDFVRGVSYCDIDQYHGDFVEYSSTSRWEPMLGTKKTMRIVYTAEKVFAAAVGHSPSDQVTIESIFGRRTQQKEEDFSFW